MLVEEAAHRLQSTRRLVVQENSHRSVLDCAAAATSATIADWLRLLPVVGEIDAGNETLGHIGFERGQIEARDPVGVQVVRVGHVTIARVVE